VYTFKLTRVDGWIEWLDPDDRQGEDLPVRGTPWAVLSFMALAVGGREMRVTPTGPGIEADTDDPRWALLAAYQVLGRGATVEGNPPRFERATVPRGAIA